MAQVVSHRIGLSRATFTTKGMVLPLSVAFSSCELVIIAIWSGHTRRNRIALWKNGVGDTHPDGYLLWLESGDFSEAVFFGLRDVERVVKGLF